MYNHDDGESSNTNGPCNFKVVLLGEGCVGKTSLVMRYIEDKFNETHQSTLQASFVTKRLNVNGRRVSLNIWDTAGQERFHALGPIYYRHAHGAVLVYDVTDADSFSKVRHWVKELRTVLGTNVSLAIAANKIDLLENQTRNVPLDTAEEYAQSVSATHIQTSAKININVERLFFELTMRMLDREQQTVQPPPPTASPSGLRLADDHEDQSEAGATMRSRGCCSTQ